MMFSKDFVWGVATASYQIEGAAKEDGRGPSIWDIFCRKPGAVFEGHTGDVATDHYHRFREDVKIMKELGIKAYRFSVSWSRILPEGTGDINKKGIEFYNNLIDELIKNDIEPYITLYHWDLPQALFERGGWLNREITDWFSEYAKVIAENFSDRVKYYFTFNEPQCFIGNGYNGGNLAPGIKYTLPEKIVGAHNVMLAHGKAVRAIREYARGEVKIGYAPTCTWNYPYDEKNPKDIKAAYDSNFNTPKDMSLWCVSWWSDPVVLGEYPKDGLELAEEYLPKTWKKDLEIISEPIDFMGQNIYSGKAVRATEDGFEIVKRPMGYGITAGDCPIEPNSIKWGSKFLYERYKLPVYITENGLSCRDTLALDGKIHDPQRIDFLQRYLLKLEEAIDEGTDVRGYFQWSLLDNFEWNKGYKERFGIVYVDYETQNRIIKDSGRWYKEVIETNGEKLHII